MSLLRTVGGFRRLWGSRSVSLLGDSMSLVALLVYIAQDTRQAIAVALLLLVGDFAPALLSPLTGTVGDRFRARSVLVTCDVVQFGAVLVIALVLPPLPVLLGLVALRAVAGQIFSAASRAMLPSLVPDEKLEEANSTLGFGGNGMEVLGPFLAAALLPSVGLRGVLLVDAATFAVSALLLLGLPSRPRIHEDRARDSFLRNARSGLRYLWTDPVLRVLTLGFFALVTCNGVDDVALVFLIRDSLGGSASQTALLYGAVGLGLLGGYAVLMARGARLPTAPLVLLGFGISSAGNLFTGLAWAVPIAFVLQAVRGLGLAAIDVASNTMLQRQVPPELLARTFGNLHGAIGVAAGLSYLLGVVLLELTSARVTFIVAGSGGVAATIVTAVALRLARNDRAIDEIPRPRRSSSAASGATAETDDEGITTMTSSKITGMHAVGVPVQDQDRALQFYTETLGLQVQMDAPIDELGARWIEVAPPSGGTSIALVLARDELRSGVETGIRLTTADAAGLHRELGEHGVQVDELLNWPGVPPMFVLHDPDGNGLEIIESQ